MIPLPPLEEQKRIVAILDEVFEGLDRAAANAKKNLANARELFDSHLNAIFTQKGDGWVEKPVSDIADHCLGKMLDKAKNKGQLKPYLRNINVRWFNFDLDDMLEMPFEADEEERYTAKKGDVLICEGGYPGRAAIWEEDFPVYFQKAIHRVRFENPLHSRWFVYYLYSADVSKKLHAYFTGTGIQHFTGQALSRFPVPLPPNAKISALLPTFGYLFSQAIELEKKYGTRLGALAELKQSILQKAFAGELTAAMDLAA